VARRERPGPPVPAPPRGPVVAEGARVVRRLRAAWQAFRNPDVLNVVVAPGLTKTQADISREQAVAIERALQRLWRERGAS